MLNYFSIVNATKEDFLNKLKLIKKKMIDFGETVPLIAKKLGVDRNLIYYHLQNNRKLKRNCQKADLIREYFKNHYNVDLLEEINPTD